MLNICQIYFKRLLFKIAENPYIYMQKKEQRQYLFIRIINTSLIDNLSFITKVKYPISSNLDAEQTISLKI